MEGNIQKFICLVCLEYYDDKNRIPKILSCQHNVCLRCAQAIVLTFGECIICPSCSSESFSSTPEELPTDMELLNSFKVLQLFFHRDRFWCLKCVGPPEIFCFSSHQVFFPAFDNELQTLRYLSEQISQNTATIQSSTAEYCIMEQEWNMILVRLEKVATAWKDKIDVEKSRMTSLTSVIHSLTTNEDEYFQISSASSVRSIQQRAMFVQNKLGSNTLAQRALDVVRNAVSAAEDLIRITETDETYQF